MFNLKYKALPCILTPPCQNGATCTNNNLGSYTCKCASGFTGANCQFGLKLVISLNFNGKLFLKSEKILKKTQALPCILTAPCQNGATCTNDNVGGYACSCLTGYTGINCQFGTKTIKKK